MIRVALKGLLGRKLRAALTAIEGPAQPLLLEGPKEQLALPGPTQTSINVPPVKSASPLN